MTDKDTNGRAPRIGDEGTVVIAGVNSHLVELVDQDAKTSWLMDFDDAELEPVS